MKITYDPQGNIIYIQLADKDEVDGKFIAKNVLVNFDAEGNVTSLEFLKASEQIDDPTGVQYVNYAEREEVK